MVGEGAKRDVASPASAAGEATELYAPGDPLLRMIAAQACFDSIYIVPDFHSEHKIYSIFACRSDGLCLSLSRLPGPAPGPRVAARWSIRLEVPPRSTLGPGSKPGRRLEWIWPKRVRRRLLGVSLPGAGTSFSPFASSRPCAGTQSGGVMERSARGSSTLTSRSRRKAGKTGREGRGEQFDIPDRPPLGSWRRRIGGPL